MSDTTTAKLADRHPLEDKLSLFRVFFQATCAEKHISHSPDALSEFDRKDLRSLALSLLLGLEDCQASDLPSHIPSRILRVDLPRLTSAVVNKNFDGDRIKSLLKAALANEPQYALIWDLVAAAATRPSTPPSEQIASSTQQTPWVHTTSSLVNSPELRQHIDKVLKMELHSLYTGLPNFHDIFFRNVPNLDATAKAVLLACTSGDDPLFNNGWTRWPTAAAESDVIGWLEDVVLRLDEFAGTLTPNPTRQRGLLAQPKTPLLGSTGKRSMDVGFVNLDIMCRPGPTAISRHRWSDILVPGELKCNPAADMASAAWIDLATYAREVLAAQCDRRFVLAFTLCGSRMRLWELDRLGGMASEQFDINTEDGALQFVTAMLAFLRAAPEELGYDPTIVSAPGGQYIEIERDGQKEHLFLDQVMKRSRCIAGRATTCWKAHRKEDPHTTLVIKDSWQYTNRDDEGEMLKEITSKGVMNISRYYHHETVQVLDADDDIWNNVRKGLDVTKATRFRPVRSLSLEKMAVKKPLGSGSRSTNAGAKRALVDANLGLPSSKRSCSTSPSNLSIDTLQNKVHRRVIMSDYGTPIYSASSPSVLLLALRDCITGHESLFKAGFLHRDISMNNLLVQESDDGAGPARGLLIDLDLAIGHEREGVSGAQAKTGTRAFMAIGALQGEHHSFMHDLESFFWVLFWICVHFSGSGKEFRATTYDVWNYTMDDMLVLLKKGLIIDEEDFINTANEHFTPYYAPLVPWVNRLRREVFPHNRRWQVKDASLYSRMKVVLEAAAEALNSDTKLPLEEELN